MALTKTFTINGGLTAVDAYHRIQSLELDIKSIIKRQLSNDGQSILSITENTNDFQVEVLSYKDSAYRNQENDEPAYIHHKFYTVPLSALNNLTTVDEDSIKTKVYTYLKTLPEFNGATDA